MDMPPTVRESMPVPTAAHPAFLHDRYLLKRQLLKLVGASFNLYDPSGTQVLQANQKGFKLKEDIRILGGPGLQQELVGIFARQVMDFSGAYDVVDLATQTKIGALRRKGLSSIVRDEWIVLDPWDREIGKVVEDSMALALVRRFLTNLVPQNYDLMLGTQRAVDLKQNFNPFSYHLNVIFEVPYAQFDRRLGIAASVLLAAIEGRQNN
ncbi:MAG: hypothetical protein ACO1SV_09110 [Fimbriimonas sp.]